jgi:hypothetical protein
MSCALGEVRLSSITSALCCWFQGHISSGLGNSTYCLAYLWNALSVWWSLLVICSSYSLFTCLLHSSLSVEFCMGLFGFYWWTSAENVAVLLCQLLCATPICFFLFLRSCSSRYLCQIPTNICLMLTLVYHELFYAVEIVQHFRSYWPQEWYLRECKPRIILEMVHHFHSYW